MRVVPYRVRRLLRGVLRRMGQSLSGWVFERIPVRWVERAASLVAWSHPVGIEPGWHFDPAAGDRRPLVLLRRSLWTYCSRKGITAPVLLRWYDGLRLRLQLGNDLSLCLFVGGSFEPNEFALMKAVLKPGMVYLDCGANEGLYTVFAAKQVGPEGTVLSFEPSSRERQRLEENLRLNALGNVVPLGVALSERPGEAVLTVAEASHAGLNTMGDSLSYPEIGVASREVVPVETLDRVVAERQLGRVDFIKIDVEGSELRVIRGAVQTLQAHHPLLQLEVEDDRLSAHGATAAALRGQIQELGYRFYTFDERTAQLRPLEPGEEGTNLIAGSSDWTPPVLK